MALLDQLAAAIAKGEGFGKSASNRPTRNNNPGDLTGTGYAAQVGTDAKGFAIFATPSDGQAALRAYLQSRLAQAGSGSGPYGSLGPSSTLQDFLNVYADNPDSGYVSTVANGAGVSPATPLAQLQAMLEAPPPAPSPAAPASTASGSDLAQIPSPLLLAAGVAAGMAALYVLLG